MIESSYEWAIYVIGSFSILFLIIAIALIALSIYNILAKKHFDLSIIVTCIVTSFLYTTIGIVFTSIAKETYGDYYQFNTSAYIPLILQAVLFIIYTIIKNPGNLFVTDKKSENKPVPVLNKAILEEEQIKKYKDLFEQGIITEEEFNAKRKQILGI